MCWCRSISAICPAFSLVGRLEETPPHFLPYPRALLLPEESQKFPTISILEVSIHLLVNCSLWLPFCATQGLGFCICRISAETLSISHLSSQMLFGLLTSRSYCLVTQCLEQSMSSTSQAAVAPSLREKALCIPCHPRHEQLAMASQEELWHHWDARVTSAGAGEHALCHITITFTPTVAILHTKAVFGGLFLWKYLHCLQSPHLSNP